ncbi:MAG: Rieske 2Fe-2S domain-containing protein [Pseudomonadota bacterium]
MSARYVPVQWNRNKYFYDAVLTLAVGAYLWLFLNIAPTISNHSAPVDGAIHNARAFGTCAFLMLTVILSIGPLARLDERLLPLLYNRRHFGVMTCLVALTHAGFVVDWYFNFSPTPKYQAVLAANTSYGQLLGFPFESLGMLALLFLIVLAVTSHDFWLSFLTPRIWKWLHYLIYPTYALIVAHVGLGVLQGAENQLFSIVVGISVTLVALLHLAAALMGRKPPESRVDQGGWEAIGHVGEIADGRAKVARLSNDERVAVFRHEGKLSAIASVCAHQNGPLGEGRIVWGCVTCPWHGFQYRVTDGCAPAPFTEKVPTFNLKLSGETVLVHKEPNPPGTYVEPVLIDAVGAGA